MIAAKPRFFYGWYIVLCGFLSHAIRMGLGTQTFGFFFKPMLEELGWSRTTLTSSLIVHNLILAGIAPMVGVLQDRYGPRWLMVGSATLLGLSMMLLSQIHHFWQLICFYGVIGAFGVPGLANGVINPMLAKRFIQRRGLVTGIAYAGINVGAIVLTPVVVLLISQYGWRTTWLILGAFPWIVVVPPALIWLRRQPEDMGLHPDGIDRQPSPLSPSINPHQLTSPQAVPDDVSWTTQAAFRTPTLWLLLTASMLYGIAYNGEVIHRIPYMTDMGFSAATAGVTLVVYSISSFFAKFLWGGLADHFPVRGVAMVILLGSAVGQALIIPLNICRFAP